MGGTGTQREGDRDPEVGGTGTQRESSKVEEESLGGDKGCADVLGPHSRGCGWEPRQGGGERLARLRGAPSGRQTEKDLETKAQLERGTWRVPVRGAAASAAGEEAAGEETDGRQEDTQTHRGQSGRPQRHGPWWKDRNTDTAQECAVSVTAIPGMGDFQG